MDTASSGLFYALGAFVLWGLFPIYWKALAGVPASEILAHRVIWSTVFLAGLLTVERRWSETRRSLSHPKVFAAIAASSCLIGLNWFVYIWAVNAGYVLETSLGYFINPLISVLLGTVILRERLRPLQGTAVAIAACGVIYSAWSYGSVPWISLVLACSFALYGLVRKVAGIGALGGLALETALLSLPAVAYLAHLETSGLSHFWSAGARITTLLFFAGIVTSMPLLWYTEAARRMPLSTIGILQYISPSLQFLLAVFLYMEQFSTAHLVTFGSIWAALSLFSLEGFAVYRAEARVRDRAVTAERNRPS